MNFNSRSLGLAIALSVVGSCSLASAQTLHDSPGAAQGHAAACPSTVEAGGCFVSNHELSPSAFPARIRPVRHRLVEEVPASRRTADQEFIGWVAAAAGATILDVESTAHTMGRPGAHEANSWIYGSHPTRARLYGTNVPIDIALSYLAYRAKAHGCVRRCGIWRLPLAVMAVVHVSAATANLVRIH